MMTSDASPLPGSTTGVGDSTVCSGHGATASGQGVGTWTSGCCCGHGTGSSSWLCFETILLRPGGRVISCLICV